MCARNQVICTLTALTDLRLERNELSVLAPLIGNLVHLRVLDVSENKLASLPRTVGNLSALVELHSNENEIANVPPSIKVAPKSDRHVLARIGMRYVGFRSAVGPQAP